MSFSPAELRIDPADGNPYTLQSFKDTYPNGQELWDAAEIWKSDGVFRIRTAPVEPRQSPSFPIAEEVPTTPAKVPEFNAQDFPAISPFPCAARSCNGSVKYAEAVSAKQTHYTEALSPYPGDPDFAHGEPEFSPEAPEFCPGDESRTHIRYNKHYSSTNDDFATLPASLWNGTEEFVQPIEDVENECIDWEEMIQTWTPEQWREFGIKYFYGYVQQSSLLMGAMPMAPEEHNDSCCSADHTCVANLWR